jgi:hypothetical protein
MGVDECVDDPAIDDVNRHLLAFAAYNAGPNRIARLRKLAPEYDVDPNVWFKNVERIKAASYRNGPHPPHGRGVLPRAGGAPCAWGYIPYPPGCQQISSLSGWAGPGLARCGFGRSASRRGHRPTAWATPVYVGRRA